MVSLSPNLPQRFQEISARPIHRTDGIDSFSHASLLVCLYALFVKFTLSYIFSLKYVFSSTKSSVSVSIIHEEQGGNGSHFYSLSFDAGPTTFEDLNLLLIFLVLD